MNRSSLKVPALLLALTLMWGTNWVLFRVALDELPVLTFRSGVLLSGIFSLGLIMWIRGESFAIPKGRWLALIVASVTNVGIWNVATSMAVLYLPSGHASVLAYTMPLWVALIGLTLYRQRLSGRLLAAIVIGAAAVVALMIPNFASYAKAPLGLFWGLVAAVSWAIGTFVVKRTDWGGMGLALTFWQVALTVPPMVLGMVVIDGIPAHLPSTETLAVMIYTGGLPMAFGTVVWFMLVQILPTQVAALSSIAIPIVAIVSGIILLHEPLSALQAVAIASTVISLWLALVPSRSV
ncbi:MAG: DMT family transporter [Enhydrobacter sp.]